MTIRLVLLSLWLLALLPPVQAVPGLGGRPEPLPITPGHPLAERLPGKPLSPAGVAAAPGMATGSLKLFFMRVDFPADTTDETTGTGEWSDCVALCNGDPDYWPSRNMAALVDYYTEVSGGRLSLEVQMSTQVFRLPQPMADYGLESSGTIEALIRDAVTAADPHVDFSLYDALFIVHAGAGEESDVNRDSPSDIWSLYYTDDLLGADNTPLTADGVTITEAVIMPQTGSQDGIVLDPLGIYAHEFGHWLGLPDLYPTSLIQTWKGIGKWGLMGDGLYNRVAETDAYGSSPAHLSAWSKLDLGWLEVEAPAAYPDPGTFSLEPVQNAARAIRFAAAPDTETRYFLLETRRQAGYDAALPGEGMLIWLVDEEVIEAGRDYNTVNNSVFTPGVKLVEADGDGDLLQTPDQGDYGSDGDPFPGSSDTTLFNPYTDPSASTFGLPGWAYVEEIAEAGVAVGFELGFSPPVPEGLAAAEKLCAQAELGWERVDALDLAAYRLYRDETLVAELTASDYRDSASAGATLYRVSAVDLDGRESPRSGELEFIPEGPACSGSSRCFIATAAHGSATPEVAILRAFRDRYLLGHAPGRWLVKTYYRFSPPLADFIRERGVLRGAVRSLLLPFVSGAFTLLAGPADLWPLLAANLVLLLGVAYSARRKQT